jgi:hypothetical protein
MLARLMGAAGMALLLLLSGCGDPSKHEIVKKAEGAKNKAQLEKALGAPDDIGKVGPVETWTYTAADGEVVFLIVGDSVSLKVTGGNGG